MESGKEWNENIEENQQFRKVKNVSFFWDKGTVIEQEERHSQHRHRLWWSQKPVAVLQRRTGKNGPQKEKETGLGNCGGERKG